jgi:hypothetical protein
LVARIQTCLSFAFFGRSNSYTSLAQQWLACPNGQACRATRYRASFSSGPVQLRISASPCRYVRAPGHQLAVHVLHHRAQYCISSTINAAACRFNDNAVRTSSWPRVDGPQSTREHDQHHHAVRERPENHTSTRSHCPGPADSWYSCLGLLPPEDETRADDTDGAFRFNDHESDR